MFESGLGFGHDLGAPLLFAREQEDHTGVQTAVVRIFRRMLHIKPPYRPGCQPSELINEIANPIFELVDFGPGERRNNR